MKILHLLIGLFISVNAFGQTLTAKFSADNCYAVYVGDNNSTSQKVLPQGNSFGVTNTTANTIFNATIVSDVQYQQGDYLYVIAWADARGCQGLIGEFEGSETVLTGELGWQVFATGRNYNPNQFPSQSLVNKMI